MSDEDKKNISWLTAIAREEWIAMVEERDTRIERVEKVVQLFMENATVDQLDLALAILEGSAK